MGWPECLLGFNCNLYQYQYVTLLPLYIFLFFCVFFSFFCIYDDDDHHHHNLLLSVFGIVFGFCGISLNRFLVSHSGATVIGHCSS